MAVLAARSARNPAELAGAVFLMLVRRQVPLRQLGALGVAAWCAWDRPDEIDRAYLELGGEG